MSPTNLSGKTYEGLRDLIVRGRLVPQKRLVEEDLAERFGVSRTPVRDALTRLRNEGYVRNAGRGRRAVLEVSPLEREEVDELWGLLGTLEAGAARAAAALPIHERGPLVERLRELNRALQAGGGPPRVSPDEMMELQSGFHRELVGRIGGTWLKRIYEFVRPHAERYEWVYGSLGEADISRAVAEHESIIALIEAGAGEGAARAIREHWDNARRRTGELIERYWG